MAAAGVKIASVSKSPQMSERVFCKNRDFSQAAFTLVNRLEIAGIYKTAFWRRSTHWLPGTPGWAVYILFGPGHPRGNPWAEASVWRIKAGKQTAATVPLLGVL